MFLFSFRAKSGHLNFGDEVSYFIVKKILDRIILQARTNNRLRFILENHFHLSSLLIQKDFRKQNRLFAVGSILGPKVNNNDVIWGSGFISGEETLASEVKQLNVLAVRGKKTLNKLMELKIPFQENVAFGDPGLLISRFITANRMKNEKIVIVPHYAHKGIFDKLLIKTNSSIEVVNARDDYKKIAKVISGASLVLSSSLHGIIFAHAYSVPAIRIKLSGKPLKGGEFKFEDYMSVFDEDVSLPTLLIEETDPEIDINKILSVMHPTAPSEKVISQIQDALITSLRGYFA